jgi:hypothetical protein
MPGILYTSGYISQQLACAMPLKTAQTCSTGALILAAEEGELILGMCFCKQTKDPLLYAWFWPNYVIAVNLLPLQLHEEAAHLPYSRV